MALSITFLGHAGFLLDNGGGAVAVDPFLTGNELARHSPSDVRCNYVALTHGHADHFGDTLDIVRQNDATLIGAFEICNYAGEQGIEKVEPGNHGGTIETDFGSVTFVNAFHSSSYQGRYMGMPYGLVFRFDGVTFYHAGDTGLFSDMQLIGDLYKPDVAAIPIGDRFTMDASHATRAAEMIKPKVAIPIHYKTFGLLAQSAEGFSPKGVEVKELDPGESWTYGS